MEQFLVSIGVQKLNIYYLDTIVGTAWHPPAQKTINNECQPSMRPRSIFVMEIFLVEITGVLGFLGIVFGQLEFLSFSCNKN